MDHITHLQDRENDVYVWHLKKGIDDTKYMEHMAQLLTYYNVTLKAHHIFLSGDIEKIKRLDRDYIRTLFKFYYSDEAQQGGRK